MHIDKATALVTGGSTGLGAAFTRELLSLGAEKVYVASRNPIATNDHRIVPVTLDVTDAASVAKAAAQYTDVTIVINNAGLMATYENVFEAPVQSIRDEMETNFFGPLLVSRAFAPVLAANGGGAFVNVHSLLGWLSVGNGYGASKTALWGLSNAIRGIVAAAGTQVLALHVGGMDTPMTNGFDMPKANPADVAKGTIQALESGRSEYLFGDDVVQSKQALQGDPAGLYIGQ
jgi:NAD(P)-dependent dehydrogenase (short-subunit alcohol dehydrogenase family)